MANIAKANPYIQRLIEDADLRENVQQGDRLDQERLRALVERQGAGPKALLEDKKLQKDLRAAARGGSRRVDRADRAPKKRARKGLGFGRKLLIVGIGGGLALAGSEKLRSKVLDTLFGAEEEFEYTPPAAPSATPPATPSAPR